MKITAFMGVYEVSRWYRIEINGYLVSVINIKFGNKK